MDPEKVAYEMRVELGLGMYIRHNKPGMPGISSILRNQIVIWVNDPELHSKCCGVMLLTSTYIPNALIDERLTIYSNTTANLSATSTQDTPIGDPVDIPEDAAVSVSVAPLDKSKKKKSSKIGRFLDRLSLKSSTSPGLPSTQELPMYETISRGWDPANLQWKNVLWPTLDHQFRLVDIQKPESAAWKLAWNIDTIPPTTPVIPAAPIVTVSKPPQLNPAVGASTSSITTDASMIASSNSFDKDDATTLSTSVASDGGADLKCLVP
ncbi:hypothetical protein B0H14DRAFT_1397582 [Mycena olivaceomarginata]|nr:hypothetical protein B0H14DRAFT_1397582 [Mycena olivaceomarginata]